MSFASSAIPDVGKKNNVIPAPQLIIRNISTTSPQQQLQQQQEQKDRQQQKTLQDRPDQPPAATRGTAKLRIANSSKPKKATDGSSSIEWRSSAIFVNPEDAEVNEILQVKSVCTSKETELERGDFIYPSTVDVCNLGKIFFFLSILCLLLSPQFWARTGWARPDHKSSDQPAWKSALSDVVSLCTSNNLHKKLWKLGQTEEN